MPSVGFVIANYVCPTIGAILSTLAFAAPTRSLHAALRNGALGSLNPTPWAFMTGNTVGWIAYSFLTSNVFVLFANAPGLLISVWLNAGAAKLQYHASVQSSPSQSTEGEAREGTEAGIAARERPSARADDGGRDETRPHPAPATGPHERRVFLIVVVWVAILSITSLAPLAQEDRKAVVGGAVNANLVFFYAAPLSAIGTVLRTKSAAALHVPTMLMNTANACFWCAYSLAIGDVYILLPNALGAAFGALQLAAYAAYARGGTREGDGTREGEGTEQFLDGGGRAAADDKGEGEVV